MTFSSSDIHGRENSRLKNSKYIAEQNFYSEQTLPLSTEVTIAQYTTTKIDTQSSSKTRYQKKVDVEDYDSSEKHVSSEIEDGD